MPENPFSSFEDQQPAPPSIADLRNDLTARTQQAAGGARDPYQRGAIEGFNAAPTGNGGLNFQRYYNKGAYAKLGFNPYVDNNALYNKKTSGSDDFADASSQWGKLFNLGFSSLWSGKSDDQESEEYERASNIGSSTRGGASAMFTNAYLNSGYTVGLLTEIAVEETILALGTAVTGGGAAPVMAARTAKNTSRLGRIFGTGAKKSSSILSRIKDIKDIGSAKSFYNAAKKVGQAINPLRGTTDYLSTMNRQYVRGADGKLEKLDAITKLQRGFGTFYRDMREINLALDEAHLESGFVDNTVRQQLITEHIDQFGEHPNADEMIGINEQAKQASENTYLNNAVLIYASNRVSFGNTFNKWMPKALASTSKKVAGGRIVKNFKDKTLDFVKHGGFMGYKTAVNEAKHAFKKSTLKKMPLQTVKFLGKYSRANFGEGAQEFFQEVIQDAEVSMAKDKYYGAMAGGIYHNSFMSEDYMNHYKESMNKFMGSEGAEVFMSGFIMGGMAGPFSRGVQYTQSQLGKLGQYTFNRKNSQRERSYQQEKAEELKENVRRFNEMTDPKKDFLKKYVDHLMAQSSYKEGMDTAQENKDEKAFVDFKDMALAKEVLFALEMDAYDLLEDKLTDMSKMSEEDLKNAFGEQIPADDNFISSFKESYAKTIERARSIRLLSQQFDELFPEVETYGIEDSDLDTGIQQQDIVKARRQAKALTILNQHSLVRTMERMEAVSKDLYGKKAPWYKKGTKQPPSSATTAIFSDSNMQKEITLLKHEIKGLKGFDTLEPEQKKDLKQKEKTLELLSNMKDLTAMYSVSLEHRNNLEHENQANLNPEVGQTVNYSRGNTQWKGEVIGETTNKKGKEQWVIQKEDGSTSKILKTSKGFHSAAASQVGELNADVTKQLRKEFDKYLQHMANVHESKLDKNKLDAAFESFKDFYALQEDEKNLTELVDLLTDPEGHMMFVERYNNMAKDQRAEQSSVAEEQMRLFQESKENQQLVEMLTKEYGIFINEDELTELVDNDIIPNRFHDVETGIPLRRDSKKHEEITSAIKTWQEETGRVETDQEIEEAEAADATPPVPADAATITSTDSFDEWPLVLQTKATEAMQKHNESINLNTNIAEETKADLIYDSPAAFVDSQEGKIKMAGAIEEYNKSIEVKKEAPITKPKVVSTTSTPGFEGAVNEPFRGVTDSYIVLDTETLDKDGNPVQAPLAGELDKGEARANAVKEGSPAYIATKEKYENDPRYEIKKTGKNIASAITTKTETKTINGINYKYTYEKYEDGTSHFQVNEVDAGGIPIRILTQAEVSKLEQFEKPVSEEIVEQFEVDTDLMDEEGAVSDPLSIHPEVEVPVSEAVMNNIIGGKSRAVTMDLNVTLLDTIVKGLKAIGHIKQNESLSNDHIGLTVKNTFTTSQEEEYEVLFTYKGKVSVEEAGGTFEMIKRLGVPLEADEVFTVPFEFDGNEYFAATENQKLWLEGSGKQHLFGTGARSSEKMITSDYEQSLAWTKEVKEKFKKGDVEEVLTSITNLNLQRKMSGKVFMSPEEIQSLYEQAKEEAVVDMKQEDFKPGEHYEMKGRLSTFGMAVVMKAYPDVNGVEFKSLTTGETKVVDNKGLATVVNKKITDMDTFISEQSAQFTDEQKEVNDENRMINKEITPQQIEEEFKRVQKMDPTDVENEFFNNAKEDEDNCK